MTQTKPADSIAPSGPDAVRSGVVEPRPPRTFVSRLFGIGLKGWVQLILVCVVLGAVFDAGGVNPLAPNFSVNGMLSALGTGALNLASWAMQSGWRPFLAGALVVFPIWLVWRLVSSPFRT